MKNPRLKTILKYKNPGVIERFSSSYGLSRRASQKVFLDLLRFLWLSNRHHNYVDWGRLPSCAPSQFQLLKEFEVIDEMWHLFLIFTQDYQKFCKKYFGLVLHHVPNLNSKVLKPDKKLLLWQKEQVKLHHEFILSELGPRVCERWFEVYPKNYSKRKLLVLQLKFTKK